jgi:hypothetical protein
LFNYCEKIDGALSWVTVFLLRSMHMSLGHQGEYQDLREYEKCFFFEAIDAKNRLETGLLCLTILLRQIQARADLM